MIGRCAVRIGALSVVAVCLALPAQPAVAGPPFVSDDPEPTDTGHFEIYVFDDGTRARAGAAGEAGIDFNYGAAPDLQLTATVPEGYSDIAGGHAYAGMGNVELAAKYRFLHQETFGLDVSVFPRIFLPSGSDAIGDNHVSLLLPIWIQKDFGKDWSAFGGGGCTINAIHAADFCEAGAVLTYQILPTLQIGAELYHQTADQQGTPASTSVGIGWRYDVTDNCHLLGYVRRGIENAGETDRYSWYAAVLFTF
jgi:Putative MetA-pathway of phenol degradation